MWTILKIIYERIFNCDIELDEWSNPYAKKDVSPKDEACTYVHLYTSKVEYRSHN